MMTERAELVSQAAAWTQTHGWRAKLAKKRGGEQSLFEHTLIETDLRTTCRARPICHERCGAEGFGVRRVLSPELP